MGTLAWSMIDAPQVRQWVSLMPGSSWVTWLSDFSQIQNLYKTCVRLCYDGFMMCYDFSFLQVIRSLEPKCSPWARLTHRQGRQTWQDGRAYEGSFKQGKDHGMKWNAMNKLLLKQKECNHYSLSSFLFCILSIVWLERSRFAWAMLGMYNVHDP